MPHRTPLKTMRSILVWFSLALVLLLTARGPGEPLPNRIPRQGQPAAVAGEPVQPVPTIEAPAAKLVGEADFNTDQVVNQDGIPVGFTPEGRPYIGYLDAPVVIEEFSDYQCPFCARFVQGTMPTLLAEEIAGGEAVLIFYDFPLEIHPQAPAAAHAARCAGEEGPAAFWTMHDRLFETVTRWSIEDPLPVFAELAADLDLDGAAFADCMAGGGYESDIDNDLAFGISRGISGTPTFFLNGQKLVGAQPLTVIQQAIAAVAAGESLAASAPADVGDIDIPPFRMPDPLIAAEDYAAIRGQADAPILIVEYTDYQCPFCARHSIQTMPRLLDELIDSGRVRYAIKDFPLDSIHPLARDTAEAARCAGEQDAYWEMHDRLFADQGDWIEAVDLNTTLLTYGDDLGLDREAFSECLDAGRYDTGIQENLDEGLVFGITGTPAFLIGGFLVSGAQPYEIFDLVVENLEAGTIETLFREAYDRQVEAYKAQVAQERQEQGPPQPSAPADIPTDGAIAIGSPDAPVTIVEYTDFQCPFCGRHFAETFPLIQENYIDKGLVRYVFKDFPLNFHEQAPKAAEAARCANEQETFMEMHQALFKRQQEWAGQRDAPERFIRFAADLGLDEKAFSTCLNSGRYAAAVESDLQEGLSYGISGTPTFFLNGQPLVGALPYATFVQAIESLLDSQ